MSTITERFYQDWQNHRNRGRQYQDETDPITANMMYDVIYLTAKDAYQKAAQTENPEPVWVNFTSRELLKEILQRKVDAPSTTEA